MCQEIDNVDTDRIGREEARGPRYCPNAPAALIEVDGVEVVRIDNTGADKTAHDLGEDVTRNLAPGEVAEGGHCNRNRGVDVPAGHTTGEPNTEGSACRGMLVSRSSGRN